MKAALSGYPELATVDAIARVTDLIEEAGAPRSVRRIVHMRRVWVRREVAEVVRLGVPDLDGRFGVEVVLPPAPATRHES